MYLVETGNCNGCGACESICPADAIRMTGGVPVIDQRLCNECGACFDACTQGAIYEEKEPAMVVSTTRPTDMAIADPDTFERGLSTRASSPTARTGMLTAAFPIVLKLAGALADYVSARTTQKYGGQGGRSSSGKGCGQAGGRGRHRRGQA